MENTICNLCKSGEYSKFIELDNYRFGRMDNRTILVKCFHCGLVFQTPRPTLAEMESHYPPSYEPFLSKGRIISNSYFINRFYKYGIEKRCSFITDYKNSGRLLEIGCGSGEFLNAIAQNPNWEIYGLERNQGAANIACQEYGLNVYACSLDERSFQSSYFDAVVLWDVLEHLHDPMSTLHEIHRILKPDGLIVLRVPNLASWDAKIFGKYWAGFDAPRHLSQFLKQTGFKIRRMSCELGSHASLTLSIRFWLTGIGIKPNVYKKLLSLFNHPITKLIMSPYLVGIGLSLWGPELTLVTMKQEK